MSQMGARWMKQWKYETSHGITRYIDPAATREHIDDLVSLGASRASIALTAGLTKSVITSLMAGQKNIRRSTAAAILTVTMTDIMGRENHAGFIPAIGAQRRIQALMAIGYRHTDLEAAGIPNCANCLHAANRRWVARSTHDQIATVFTRLCMTPGPSTKAVSNARKRGYAPPLAWDDIDDPNAIPNLGERTRRPGGQRFSIEDLDFILDNDPMTIDQTAARFHVHRSSIEHACARADRHDLLTRMARNKALQENVA